MKKLFSGLVIASTIFLFSCENEELNPKYPFTIIVKTQSDSLRVQNVLVEVAAPVPGNQVWLKGATNTEGEIDFEPLLQILLENGYRGLALVELSRDAHRAPTLVEQSIRFLKEAEDRSRGGSDGVDRVEEPS